jgi:hypothetical protein
MPKKLILTRRVTSPFLQAIPQQIEHFDAYMYVVVPRKNGKDIPGHEWGTDVRLEPVELDWDRMNITVTIPLNINYGIRSFDDLDPNFFESIEVAFLSLMHAFLA